MTTELVDAADALHEEIDAAIAARPDGPVPPEVMAAISAAGLEGLMVPEAVGGRQLPLVDVVDCYAALSRADGSVGWCHFAVDSATTYFGAYLPEEGVAELFAEGVPVVAGQFAPNGVATAAGDDWLIEGDYQFGSGTHLADWIGAGVVTVPSDGGDGAYLFTCVPAAEAELRDNWDVLGLRATASVDYRIEGAKVPASRTFDFFAPVVHRGGPVYEMGVIPLTAAGHAGWAIGVTRRLLDELAAFAVQTRMGAPSTLGDSEHFQLTYGGLESRWAAGRAWVREVLVDAEDEARRTGRISERTVAAMRQSCVHVNRGGADIAEEAYLLAGTRALREGPFQRAYRDLHAGSQHFFASPAATLDYARDLLS